MLELRAVYRVGEVGVRVDVHDVDHLVRLGHAAAHRKADRVVAANRYYHGASLRDLARRGRRARLAEGHIATRDENIPTVREPDALEVMPPSPDVEPTGADAIRAGFPEPGSPLTNQAPPGGSPRPGA